MKLYLCLLLLGLSAVNADVYFKDYFRDDDDSAWETRWLESKHKSDYGKWKLTPGDFYNDEQEDKGLQTTQDAKFYAISTKFEKFSNEEKPLVIQFSVKHQQSIDCGGGYIKVFPSALEPADMHGESQYNIMFGPDICGPGTKKVHVIFNYKGKNLLVKRDIRCKDDEMTHIYTLIVRPDNTYQVLIDNSEAQKGNLEDDWDFLEPKQIKDPDASKPPQEEWDEREKIPDPDDTKPEDWEQPEHIVDPDADKPEDWDDEMDGEWEAPMIDNPDYKGEWKPKEIDNPAYKGKWVHPMVDNPDYVADDKLYFYEDTGAVGLDLWQVKSGTVFDNFLITDDVDLASEEAEIIKKNTIAGEKKMKEAKEEEDKKKSEEAAADEDEEDVDEDEDDMELPEDDEEPEDAAEDEAAPGKDEL